MSRWFKICCQFILPAFRPKKSQLFQKGIFYLVYCCHFVSQSRKDLDITLVSTQSGGGSVTNAMTKTPRDFKPDSLIWQTKHSLWISSSKSLDESILIPSKKLTKKTKKKKKRCHELFPQNASCTNSDQSSSGHTSPVLKGNDS